MDTKLLKLLLSRLGRHAFEAFAFEVFTETYGDHFKMYQKRPLPLYLRELEDYLFPPDVGEKQHFGLFEGIYVFDYLPLEVFNNPTAVDIESEALKKALNLINRNYEYRVFINPTALCPERVLYALYFINNISGFSVEDCRNYILPKYDRLLKNVGLSVQEVYVGNIDTFVDLRPQETASSFKAFLSRYHDGICVELSKEEQAVHRLTTEKYLLSGVSKSTRSLYEPVYISRLQAKEEVLQEFEELIRRSPNENKLESFLKAHYKDIFGEKYDRIETQLWLKFPQLDIGRKERRLDIFLRNSITNDWELFEVKKTVRLTGNYRDCPVLARELMNAIQQVKNYARILSQDVVKKSLAKEGIEYFEPSLHLVVGKRPQIPHSQWRWLLKTNAQDVKIITFDDLLEEMKLRFRDRLSVLENL